MKPAARTGEPIVIADYDPAWPERFARERALIVEACGPQTFLAIEHIGSTSVPGLAAKPIIDIMPGVRSLDAFAPAIAKLEGIGYEYVPEFERPIPEMDDPGMPFRRYFRKDAGGERAFHLHVVEMGSGFWRDHLVFRDYLRAHPEAAAAYADLKRAIAADYNAALQPHYGSIERNKHYTDRKSDFVAGTMAAARAEAEAAAGR